MFYKVFLFLLCLSMYSDIGESTDNTSIIYIDGYNLSNAIKINKTADSYQYEKDELLNISCHFKRTRPVLKLTWLHNWKPIPGKENHTSINTLTLNITERNNKDTLTCYASEDINGLKHGEITNNKREAILILNYHKTSAPTSFKDMLFWIVVVVFIVVIIISAILTCACIKSYRNKEYKVDLHPAISNTSVFTTGSRTPIIPRHKITKEKVRMHPPVVNASYFTANSRTLPIPQHKMANDQEGLTVSNVSYFTTDSRKPTNVQYNIAQARFYTNNNCNKTQLHNSREIIDSEYQEPIDSQAYCEPQMYSEPEKQFYAEPIPKILRKTKDTSYVNYNKSNGSANINNENIDLYQNCEHISDNEFYYYTETS